MINAQGRFLLDPAPSPKETCFSTSFIFKGLCQVQAVKVQIIVLKRREEAFLVLFSALKITKTSQLDVAGYIVIS